MQILTRFALFFATNIAVIVVITAVSFVLERYFGVPVSAMAG